MPLHPRVPQAFSIYCVPAEEHVHNGEKPHPGDLILMDWINSE